MIKYLFYIIFIIAGNLTFASNSSVVSTSGHRFNEEYNNEISFCDLQTDQLIDEIVNETVEHFVPSQNNKKSSHNCSLFIKSKEDLSINILLLNTYIDLPPPRLS